MGQPQNSIATRLQRNVLSKLSKPGIVKHVISDSYSTLLDVMYIVLRKYYAEKVAEKVIKNIVKIVVKLAFVFKDEKKMEEHEYPLDDIQEKFRSLLLTVHSFDQLTYSYSQTYLLKQMDETEESLLNLVKPILSEKSSIRIRFIFEHFKNPKMIDSFFQQENGPHAEERAKFMDVIAGLQF